MSSRSLPRDQEIIYVQEETHKKITTIIEDFYKSKHYEMHQNPISVQIIEHLRNFLIGHLDNHWG